MAVYKTWIVDEENGRNVASIGMWKQLIALWLEQGRRRIRLQRRYDRECKV